MVSGAAGAADVAGRDSSPGAGSCALALHASTSAAINPRADERIGGRAVREERMVRRK
jgi:hypothetical protein